MYRIIREGSMPRWLKVMFSVLLTITCVYWIGYWVYKILDIVRVFMHWVTDKGHWWVFIVCIMLTAIVSLLMAQFVWGLDPFGKMWAWVCSIYNLGRDLVADKIHS